MNIAYEEEVGLLVILRIGEDAVVGGAIFLGEAAGEPPLDGSEVVLGKAVADLGVADVGFVGEAEDLGCPSELSSFGVEVFCAAFWFCAFAPRKEDWVALGAFEGLPNPASFHSSSKSSCHSLLLASHLYETNFPPLMTSVSFIFFRPMFLVLSLTFSGSPPFVTVVVVSSRIEYFTPLMVLLWVCLTDS